MAADLTLVPIESWKDKLLRKGIHGSTGEEVLDHVRDLCLSKETVMNGEMAKEVVIVDLPEKEKEKMEEPWKSFGPRMFVERKSLNNSRAIMEEFSWVMS
ncbi:hypothetical protein GOBAR_AA34420 [Gossypium barbadense]|uniref:Uncharacterized protein n=1 Tax=Gossypium barbadense TaxID=3634 RepID=A0A2P5W5B0_GOSBA|nr:hypothetical protein GOBAR_AA34420 [Gossypium barbadense]